MRIKTLVFFTLLLLSLNVKAIVIRHDIADQQYLDLGEQYTASVAYINGCAATLIDREWLLTAAHCLKGAKDNVFTIRHINSRYRIEKIIVHPQFQPSNDEVFDIALVQLQDPIENGQPVEVYKQTDENGQPVIFVGRGSFGDGLSGPRAEDFKQRGATNTVDSVNKHVVGFTFNSPETATQYEGISSRGDSGGPALVTINDQLFVIGVSSYQEFNGFKEGRYGVREFYTRVSSHYSWIKQTIETTPTPIRVTHPIIEDIKHGNVANISKYLSAKEQLSQRVIDEAFYQAVVLNQIASAQLLIKAGIDFTHTVINHDSLFVFALKQNRKAFYRMLQQQLPSPNAAQIHQPNSVILPLYISVFLDEQDVIFGVQQIIAQGGNLNAQSKAGDTALIIAGWNSDNFDLIKTLVSSGADINIANNNGDTPLIDAAYLNKVKNLAYLIESGAELSHKNKRGETALMAAQKRGNTQAEIMLKKAI